MTLEQLLESTEQEEAGGGEQTPIPGNGRTLLHHLESLSTNRTDEQCINSEEGSLNSKEEIDRLLQ